jgi:hypothetical protein
MLAATCGSIALVGLVGAAEATVVTFDGLPDGLVANGYGGINWNSNWITYSEDQPPYNPESYPDRVYTFSTSAGFDFLAPATFQGAYFSGYSYAPVQFYLYDGATLVGISGVLDPSSTPTFLASGYGGLVTSVVVQSPDPDFYVMDNVTYNSGVPEPAAWSLMLLGLGSLGAGLRNGRRRSAVQSAAV